MTTNRILSDDMTQTQRRAHNALALLLSEEGMENTNDVYAAVTAKARENAFAQRYGLTRCYGTVCLGRLFRKRCQHIGESDGMPHTPPGNEHPSLWARDGSPVAYVFQPYKDALTADLLERLAEFCQEYGLAFTVSESESFHYPNRTTLVMIARK